MNRHPSSRADSPVASLNRGLEPHSRGQEVEPQPDLSASSSTWAADNRASLSVGQGLQDPGQCLDPTG